MALRHQIFTVAGEEFVRAKADINPDCKKSYSYKVYGKVKIAQQVCLLRQKILIGLSRAVPINFLKGKGCRT